MISNLWKREVVFALPQASHTQTHQNMITRSCGSARVSTERKILSYDLRRDFAASIRRHNLAGTLKCNVILSIEAGAGFQPLDDSILYKMSALLPSWRRIDLKAAVVIAPGALYYIYHSSTYSKSEIRRSRVTFCASALLLYQVEAQIEFMSELLPFDVNM